MIEVPPRRSAAHVSNSQVGDGVPQPWGRAMSRVGDLGDRRIWRTRRRRSRNNQQRDTDYRRG